ncbi:MAG: nucleotidyltransferase family protein [Pseudomonadota bacterium]
MRTAPGAVMIFAAGFGTRMGELTKDRPKPLIPVGGKPLIDHALDIATGAGVGHIVVNTHYRADQVRDYLADRAPTVIEEAPEILDTGGGLKNAAPVLGTDPVFTLNSDAVWSGPNPLTQLAKSWDPARMDALLLVVPEARAHGRLGGGDFDLDGDGRPVRKGPYVYTGAQILRTGPVLDVPDRVFSLNRVWDALAAEQRLFATIYPGHWGDVGHPAGLAEAERMLAGV